MTLRSALRRLLFGNRANAEYFEILHAIAQDYQRADHEIFVYMIDKAKHITDRQRTDLNNFLKQTSDYYYV